MEDKEGVAQNDCFLFIAFCTREADDYIYVCKRTVS